MTPEPPGTAEIFDGARELPIAEQSAYLDRACAGDAELRQQVESLLEHDQAADSILDRPAWESLPVETRDVEGALLGPYRLEKRLGAGGMGEVYRATDTRLGRNVAIKVSHARFSQRFQSEAQAIAALNHPYICTLYDVGPDYLVMECVEGSPLKGPLAEAKALEYAAQILDALDAAHVKKIAHGDLKPANILVTKQGIKLLDFGLAHGAAGSGDQAPADSTQDSVVMGTPAYMAPEQWEGRPADAQSDIYAFGCVLYEILTGKQAGSSRAPLEEPRLESIVSTCLAKDPGDRWHSARDIKRALALPVAARPRRKAGLWRWAAVASLLAAAILGSWFWRLRTPVPTPSLLRFQLTLPKNGQLVLGNTPEVGGIALSPDGTTAAAVVTVNGKTGLWVSPLDGSPPRLLEGTDNAAYPFWSPDSNSIAFVARRMLWRADVAIGKVFQLSSGIGLSGAWLDDGTILIGSPVSGLTRVSLSGTRTPLTSLDPERGETGHLSPQSLGGDHFLYLAQSKNQPRIYAASVQHPERRIELVRAGVGALYGSGHLLFQRGSTLMAQRFDPEALRLSGEPVPLNDIWTGLVPHPNASVSANGVLLLDVSGPKSLLTWVDRRGRKSRTVGEPGIYGTPRLSRDGRSIVVERYEPDGAKDLWIVDAESGLERRLTSDPDLESQPLWAPDGRTVVFTDSRNLFSKDVTGARPKELLVSHSNLIAATDWSRDGTRILYHDRSVAGTFRNLGVLEVTAAGEPKEDGRRPYLETPTDESLGRFSPEPNPRWVAYQSNESGRLEVYIDSFPERRGAVRVSTAGGMYPQWGEISGNGRVELFYVSLDSKLMSVDLTLGRERVEASAPKELFGLSSAETGTGTSSVFDAAADGQHFLVRVPVEEVRTLTVIVNWPALLQKSPAAR